MKTTHASDFHHNPLFQTSKELKKEKHFIGITEKHKHQINVRVIGDACTLSSSPEVGSVSLTCCLRAVF